MATALKKVILVSCVVTGILAGSLLFPRAAFAPHAEKTYKDSKKVKVSKQTVYVKCPHCGKKIKIYVKKP